MLRLMHPSSSDWLSKRSGQRFWPLHQDFHGARMNLLFVMGDGWICQIIHRISLTSTGNVSSLLVLKAHALRYSRPSNFNCRLSCLWLSGMSMKCGLKRSKKFGFVLIHLLRQDHYSLVHLGKSRFSSSYQIPDGASFGR